jgi:membrane-associated phospholipid phosphatase
LTRKPYTSYNLFFLIPFVLWIATGGLLLILCDKQVLFAAFNTHHTDVSDIIMYYFTWLGEGNVVTIMLLLLLFIVPVFRNWWFFVAALLCNVLPTVVTQIIKHMANASRPLKYFHKAAWIHILPDWDHLYNQSFPSGHSTGAFALYCFLSMLLPVRYKWVGLLFFCIAFMVVYSRMYVAAHFFADVYTGSIIGGTVSLAAFSVMRRYQHYFFKNK